MRLFPRRLPKRRLFRYPVVLAICGGYLIGALLLLALTCYLLFQNLTVRGWFFSNVLMLQYQDFPTAETPTNAVPATAISKLDATKLSRAGEFLRTTNVWPLHLQFTSNQWVKLKPVKVPTDHDALHFETGEEALNNPNASRAGILGVLGLDLPWSEAKAVDIGGVTFTNVATRFKGNGTMMGSLRSYQRSLKFDLNKNVKGRKFLGMSTLNVRSTFQDPSSLREAMGYEYYREAGIRAPRTAFAEVLLTVDGRLDRHRIGFFEIVENPDAHWAKEQFDTKEVALFKPVTHHFFEYLGSDWEAYQTAYDPKNEPTPVQQRRVIDFSRLVSYASDKDFAAQLGDFVDLDDLARFMAVEVVIANYDGILSNGQNFLMYLDPKSNRFGFVPWDLDHSWGEFPLIGTNKEREQASIMHPWIGKNRFLERVYKVESFQTRYRAELERHLRDLFIPSRLSARIDAYAEILRPYLTLEPGDRLKNFEVAVAMAKEPTPKPDPKKKAPPEPPFNLKHFLEQRAISVRAQLDGKSEGVLMGRK